MRTSTVASAAAILLAVPGCACGPTFVTPSGDGQQTGEEPDSPGDDSGSGSGGGSGGSGGGGGSGGSGGEGGGSGGSGNGGGSGGDGGSGDGGDSGGGSGDEGSGSGSDPLEETESTEGPILLALGESHRFEDGFTVSMGPVERRTEPGPVDHSDTGVEEGTGDEDGSVEDEPVEEAPEDVDGEDLDSEDPSEEEALDEDPDEPLDDNPTEEPEDGDPFAEPALENDGGDEPAEDEPAEDDPVDDAPVEEPAEDPEDDGEDYYAWTVTITNGTDEDVHTGSVITECSVGAPLTLSSAPVLGEALNPPMTLAPDQQGAWDEDCWASEDDSTLQWTLEFIDEEGRSLYPVLVFEGQVA